MKKKLYSGFTLIEMLVVLLIVSLLVLMFIPNLSNQKETVTKQGHTAVVKSVETQLELFEMEHNRKMTAEEMKDKIDAKQLEIYQEAKK
ncbi:competence type IV pilus major pilin ComGC [Enterococcus olivae]